MKVNSIINRYIFKEMLSPFFINIIFFMFVFLLTEILEITNMIVNYKINILSIAKLMAYSMPYFLVFIIPMSVMMAVLLTFLKMSSDNEITALKSGGINIYQLLPPVFVFCLAGCFLTGIMIIYGLPWGKMSLKQLTIDVARSNIDIGLKERTFNNSFKGVMLYVNKIDLKNKELIDIFIQDERTHNAGVTIIAPKGKLFSDPENLLFHLKLFNGNINQVDIDKRSVNSVNFDTYDVKLDLKKAVENAGLGPKDGKEMSLAELYEYINNAQVKDTRYYGILIEFHRKFSIPFACIALGLLAVPLGVQSKSARKSFGLGLGLLLFLFYYLLLSAGLVFGEAGKYPPLIGMWVPNIVTGGIGIFLLNRTVKGRPVYIDMLPRLIKIFQR